MYTQQVQRASEIPMLIISSWNGPSGQPPLNKHSEDGDANDDIFILKLGTDI